MSSYYVRKNTKPGSKVSENTLMTRISLLYRLMKANTAKCGVSMPSGKELRGGWKHYVDVLSPFMTFDVPYSSYAENAFIKQKRITNPVGLKKFYVELVNELKALHNTQTINQPVPLLMLNHYCNVEALRAVPVENINLFIEANRLIVSALNGEINETYRVSACGRRYVNGVTLQNVSRSLRTIALRDMEHSDIDQVSAAWFITLNLLESKGADLTRMKDWIPCQDKDTRNSLIFGGLRRSRDINKRDASSDWRDIVYEHFDLDLRLKEHRTRWSYLVFAMEAELQSLVEDKLEDAGHQIISHIFDGCLVTGTVSKKELTRIENEIKEEMGLTYFQLKNKGRC